MWMLAGLLVGMAAHAQEGRFQVGQRVRQPSTGRDGTVVQIQPEKTTVWVRFDDPEQDLPPVRIFWGTPDLVPSKTPEQAPLSIRRPADPKE
jgi:hypothetical protein